MTAQEPLYTIAKITDITRLSRRTVQFWADNDVLDARDPSDRAPRLFSKQELQVAKMLVPFVQMFGDNGTPLRGLQLIARGFRDILRDRINVRPRPGKSIQHAMAGEQVYLVVQIVPTPDDSNGFRANMSICRTAEELGAAQVNFLHDNPALPPATIDLTHALADLPAR